MAIVFFWILFSVLVGAFASSRGQGFFAGFFVSLMLSPIVGGIVFLIMGESNARKMGRIEQEERMRAAARAKIEKQG